MELIQIGESVKLDLKDNNVKTPDNYSVENALKAAFLTFYDTDDGIPVHQGATDASIQNALFNMIVQGLDPLKKQCYFWKIGNRLKCWRSYLGDIAVAKRTESKIKAVNAAVIYEGDVFESEIINGIQHIRKHIQKIEHIKKDKILAAYSVAIDQDDNLMGIDLMTFEDIKNAWKHSQVKKPENKPILPSGELNPNSNHGKHPERYCRRTVIKRLCKSLISSTDDHELLKASRATDSESDIETIVSEEIRENANQKLIDFNEPDSVASKEEMAIKDQARMIVDLSDKLGQKEIMMEKICEFFDKKITQIRQLTFEEANRYIDHLNEQPPKPDWMK